MLMHRLRGVNARVFASTNGREGGEGVRGTGPGSLSRALPSLRLAPTRHAVERAAGPGARSQTTARPLPAPATSLALLTARPSRDPAGLRGQNFWF